MTAMAMETHSITLRLPPKTTRTITMGITPGLSDPILTRLVAEDKVPWYKKKNLRFMYLCLAFGCMGVEMTSGFDSTLIGTLQFSPPWNKCRAILSEDNFPLSQR